MHGRARIGKYVHIRRYLYIHINLDFTHERKRDTLDMSEMCSEKPTTL